MTIIAIILAYLTGSIPTAYIYGKAAKGIDIRQYGSGNVGATNVFRTLGKTAGIIVLLIDILKGTVAVVLFSKLFALDSNLAKMALAIAAVCGHNWTIFLSFKGGKGIATSLGVLIGLAVTMTAIRPVLGGALVAWLIVFLISGIVSLASVVAAVSLVITSLVTGAPLEVILLSSVFAVFVVYRHRANLERLKQGKEPVVNWPFKR